MRIELHNSFLPTPMFLQFSTHTTNLLNHLIMDESVSPPDSIPFQFPQGIYLICVEFLADGLGLVREIKSSSREEESYSSLTCLSMHQK